jgi:hypothetical protein
MGINTIILESCADSPIRNIIMNKDLEDGI